MTKHARAFSLVELMVTIAIIGILAAILIATLSGARERAQDATRMADLETIAKALGMYYVDHRNFIESESGCGSNGNGGGYFNFSGGNYPKSIAQCLIDAGYLSSEILDPTGARVSNGGAHTYLKSTCTQNDQKVTYLYAALASKPRGVAADTAGTCYAGAAVDHGINYWIKI